MARFVTIFSSDKAPEAHIVRGMLESAGIPAVLRNEHLISAQWMYAVAVGGIEVQVLEEDSEAACELLRQASAQDAKPFSSLGPPGEAEFSSESGKEDGEATCPRCGNPAERYRYQGLFTALSFCLCIPFPRALYHWRCAACGKKWK